MGGKPVLPPQAWELLLELAARARRQVEEGGEWLPLIVAISNSGTMVMQLSGWSQETKHQAMQAAGALAAPISPTAVALVCDSYYRPRQADEPAMTTPTGSLADDPQALDAICLAVADRAGDTCVRLWPYRREVDGLAVRTTWLEEVFPDEVDMASPLLASFWQGVQGVSP